MENDYFKAEVLDKKINDETRLTIYIKEYSWYYAFDEKTGLYLNVVQSETQIWKTDKDNYINIKNMKDNKIIGDYNNSGKIEAISFESISKGIKIPVGSFVVNLDGNYTKEIAEIKDFNGVKYSSI